MDHEEALAFLAQNHHAVFMTYRRNGSPQMSPVAVGVNNEGVVVVSTRASSAKVLNARRDPRVSLCVFGEQFFGSWLQIDGICEVVDLPQAMDGLIAYYRQIAGEHPDWDEYRRAMDSEQRVLLRVSIDRVAPTSAA